MSIRTRVTSTAVLLGLALCAACAGLPKQGPIPSLYALTPKSTFAADLPRVTRQIALALPVTSRALDTDRIATRPSPHEYRYYKDVRWSGNLTAMLQTLLLESFENCGAAAAVGREASILRADYLLLTDIREFQTDDFGPDSPKANVRVSFKIVRQPEARIIDAQIFSAEIHAGSGAEAVVTAFDQALGSVLKQGVDWSLRRIAADAAR